MEKYTDANSKWVVTGVAYDYNGEFNNMNVYDNWTQSIWERRELALAECERLNMMLRLQDLFSDGESEVPHYYDNFDEIDNFTADMQENHDEKFVVSNGGARYYIERTYYQPGGE